MEQSLIELSHITKLYTSGEQTVCALSIPALKVHTREGVSVVGPSGSGYLDALIHQQPAPIALTDTTSHICHRHSKHTFEIP